MSKVNKKDSLGNRMKGYENAFRHYLPGRMPVIVRIDGNAFHTYTKGMEKPFDYKLNNAMWEATKFVTENVGGCKIAYHQSDEVSLLITNYDKLTTSAWFDNNLQKFASICSSMFTAKFNEVIHKDYPEKKLAIFDARAFVLSKEEVNNYFVWRQQDATRNSVSMVAQANFPHKELQNLNSTNLKEKLLVEKDISWENLPVFEKRGVCIRKLSVNLNGVTRNSWDVDHETPVFSGNTDYINQFVYLNEN